MSPGVRLTHAEGHADERGSCSELIKTLDGFSHAVGITVIRWLALAMVLVQFAIIVVARYVFGLSDVAVNESVLYMHATLFMLGAGYTLLVNGHVRVDIFYNRLSEAGQRRIDLFGHVFLLIPTMIADNLYWSWPAVVNCVEHSGGADFRGRHQGGVSF